MFIKYIDMMIAALQIEFKQVAFITFQIILKTIPIIKIYLALKKMIISYLRCKTKCFLPFVVTESGFKTFGFVKHSFIVPALSISLIDPSTNSEFLKAEELFFNSAFEGM